MLISSLLSPYTLKPLIAFLPPSFPFDIPDAVHTSLPLTVSSCSISLLYVLLNAIRPALLILRADLFFSAECVHVTLCLTVRQGTGFEYSKWLSSVTQNYFYDPVKLSVLGNVDGYQDLHSDEVMKKVFRVNGLVLCGSWLIIHISLLSSVHPPFDLHFFFALPPSIFSSLPPSSSSRGHVIKRREAVHYQGFVRLGQCRRAIPANR